MIDSNWTCPNCDNSQVVHAKRYFRYCHRIEVEEAAEGNEGFCFVAIVCVNNRCKKTTFSLQVGVPSPVNGQMKGIQFLRKRISSTPTAPKKPLPDFIPQAIRQDFGEACLIADLSPKAAATLARRCLQGMIRDFFKISRPTLDLEIKELRRQVEARETQDPVSVTALDAIDAVRRIGNIGAHMEKDIDLIIDVDPDEARLLLDLLETLIEDWYVERQRRRDRFQAILAIDQSKTRQKNPMALGLPVPEDRSPDVSCES